MVDELIRDITEPAAGAPIAAKFAARERLLAAMRAQEEVPPKRRRRMGRRGIAVAIALLAVPSGIAVATEMSRDPVFKSAADCPEFFTGLQERNLSAEGVRLADCPVGAEVDQLLSAMSLLQERREEIGDGGEPRELGQVVGFGRNSDGQPWSIVGIAGEGEPGPSR